jgi:hypothetical protein
MTTSESVRAKSPVSIACERGEQERGGSHLKSLPRDGDGQDLVSLQRFTAHIQLAADKE